MIRQDDRTPAERTTHTLAVVGRDKFMSGWGGARGGYSRAAWAFNPAEVNADRVENWVRSRSDMQYVSLVRLNGYRPPRDTAHFHIYTVGPDHPAPKWRHWTKPPRAGASKQGNYEEISNSTDVLDSRPRWDMLAEDVPEDDPPPLLDGAPRDAAGQRALEDGVDAGLAEGSGNHVRPRGTE
jgi:hypothetical protein